MKLAAIVVFDEVEELDFVGPLEVLGMTGRLLADTTRAFTCSTTGDTIRGRYGLTVRPDYSFENMPDYDLLLVPGGLGARKAMKDPATLDLVREAMEKAELVTSVCTGALVLASAGILDGKKATTHWAALDELSRQFPQVTVLRDERFVQDGKIVTSAGVSAGIDMALYLVERYFGAETSREVAHNIEYSPRPRQQPPQPQSHTRKMHGSA